MRDLEDEDSSWFKYDYYHQVTTIPWYATIIYSIQELGLVFRY